MISNITFALRHVTLHNMPYDLQLVEMTSTHDREKLSTQRRQTAAIKDLLEDTNARLKTMEEQYELQSGKAVSTAVVSNTVVNTDVVSTALVSTSLVSTALVSTSLVSTALVSTIVSTVVSKAVCKAVSR